MDKVELGSPAICIHLEPFCPVPAETASAARAGFPKGHPYLCMRDMFGALFDDPHFGRGESLRS
jgi:hypothetical protein